MVALKWAVRGLGLLSTLILVRWLNPSDFGLVAMAAMTIGFVDVLLSSSVDLAIIQSQSKDRADYDSAWTLRILQSFAAGALVLLAIPFAVAFFNEPRLEPILWAMTTSIVFGGFSNIGTVMFRMNLRFDLEFRFELARKFVAFCATIVSAYFLRNYWALVIGSVTGVLLGTLMSYGVHPYRPRLCFTSVGRLWSFSKWTMIYNVGYYVESKVDELVVGRKIGVSSVGLYSVASEIATLPTTELAMPISRALLPGYALLQNERERLNQAFLNAFGMILLVAIPAASGLAALSADIVDVLLGEKWTLAIPIIQILAVNGALRIVYSSVANLLIATGRMRSVAFFAWMGLICFVFVGLALVSAFGLVGVAFAKLGVNFLVNVVSLWTLLRLRGFGMFALASRAYRPLCAALVMVGSLLALPSSFPRGTVVALVLQIAMGVALYAVSVIGLWMMAGRPNGAERIVLEWVRSLAGRITRS